MPGAGVGGGGGGAAVVGNDRVGLGDAPTGYMAHGGGDAKETEWYAKYDGKACELPLRRYGLPGTARNGADAKSLYDVGGGLAESGGRLEE